jgi:sulfoxide reductase heme-binding subunit YedZ
MTGVARAGGSQLLWFVSRGSGLVLMVTLSAVVVLGVATRLGAAPFRLPRFVTMELHRTLSLFALAILALHVTTALLDPYVSIGWRATVVPFTSPYRPGVIALGTLAVDLIGAAVVTSLLRKRLGYRAWRVVHWLAYLAWPLAMVHALEAGPDSRLWWAGALEWASIGAVATAVMARVLAALRTPAAGSQTERGRAISHSRRNPPSVGERAG